MSKDSPQEIQFCINKTNNPNPEVKSHQINILKNHINYSAKEAPYYTNYQAPHLKVHIPPLLVCSAITPVLDKSYVRLQMKSRIAAQYAPISQQVEETDLKSAQSGFESQ